MSLAKFSWREIKARPSRVLLTFLSIAIGVGAVVAVLLATSTTRSAQRGMLKAIAGKADLELLANSPKGFPFEFAKRVRNLPGVDVAVPSLNRIATLFAGEKKARTQVLGIDPRIDQEIREYEVAKGALPTSLGEVLLAESLANSLEIQVGDKVKLLGAGGLQEFECVGIVRASGTAGFSLGGAVYMVLPAAQSLFRAKAQIDQVLVSLSEDSDPEVLSNKIADELGNAVTVRVPRTSSDMARETMYATENGMHMAIAFALLIAAFIIYNTFQMAVGERRKQLGILRAIGATRKQVSNAILREALWLSILGAIAGCGLGYWGAGLLNGVTESMLQVDLPSVQLSILPFAIASALGIGVAMLGALLPAHRAGSVQPMEAMRAIELHHNDDVIRRTRPLGFIAIPLGLLLLYCAIHGWLPIGADVVAIVLVLLGVVLLIPVLLDRCSTAILHLIRPWIGAEAKLAQKQMMRHVGRSTLTIGVLFIAVSTCVGMTGNILDNVDNVRAWYERAVIGDFFIRASTPDFSTGASADLPDEIEEQVREFGSVLEVEPMTFVTAQSGEDSLLVISREFVGEPLDYFDLVAGDPGGLIEKLTQGEVVVGSVLAQRRGLQPGDSIELQTEQGAVSLTIAATTNEYIAGGLTVYASQTLTRDLLGVDGASALIITADPKKLQQAEANLQAFCKDNGLILQSHAEMVAYIHSMVNGVIASMWMLLGLGCTIAAMGLVNTLTMNIIEQTREIGMLRVVAMTRSQVRRMVVAQAALLGVIGLVPGALAGIFVAYAISQSAMSVLGHNIIFHFRPGLVVGCVGFGLVVILLASLIPAERAARLKLSSALQYE